MTAEFDDIVKRLPKLTAAELRSLAVRVGFLVSMARNGDDSSDTLLALEGISQSLQSRGMEFVSVERLRKQNMYQSFAAEKVPAVMRYLEPAKLSRNETRAMLKIGIDLLIHHLDKSNRPASAWMLMANFDRIPSLLNSAFPGYAESGVIGMIVKRDSK